MWGRDGFSVRCHKRRRPARVALCISKTRSQLGRYFPGELNCRTLTDPRQDRLAMTTIDYDHQAEAGAAMELAAAPTSDADRFKWLRVAVAQRDLARNREGSSPVITRSE
jgi:hypothetical protein